MVRTDTAMNVRDESGGHRRIHALIQEIIAAGALGRSQQDILAFLERHLANARPIRFGDKWIINAVFPPFPSRAFTAFVEQQLRGEGTPRAPYSASLAITNRCPLTCRHCSNAGRSTEDVPFAVFRRLAGELQDLGTVTVSLTGGEPLLRGDLPDICACFDDRAYLTVNTSGWGFSAGMAHRLRDRGVFALAVSLDSPVEQEHDWLRRRRGAYRAALEAIGTARREGLYPFVVAVARRELLEWDPFVEFLRVAGEAGALEVRFLEPVPVGRWWGQPKVAITGALRQRLLRFQEDVSRRDDLPLFFPASALGASEGLGCQAGVGHFYIDGSGEVCPCNFVPLSFGNIRNCSLRSILDRMHEHFGQARPSCAARELAPHVPGRNWPTPPHVSAGLCRAHLPATPVPKPGRPRRMQNHSANLTTVPEAIRLGHAPCGHTARRE